MQVCHQQFAVKPVLFRVFGFVQILVQALGLESELVEMRLYHTQQIIRALFYRV